jgi:hypothetical protein
VTNLVKADSAGVVSLLNNFLDILEGKYRVVIVSPKQARGLDFNTDNVIEDNGGVHVLIAKLPERFLHY